MKRSIKDVSDAEISLSFARWANAATKQEIKDGLIWYKAAQDHCRVQAKRYGISTYNYATIVSMLSPNNKWERNLIDADQLVSSYLAGESIDDFKVCTYGANKLKAWNAMSKGSEIDGTNSPKTHSFAMNMIGSIDSITIDKWMIRAALCGPDDGVIDTVESVTPKQYRRLEALCATVAQGFGMAGHSIQAIIWLTIKRHWGR